MPNIIAFTGSPRKEGNTRRLLNELIEGAEAKGGEVKVYDLNEPGIRGCQGCFYCRSHPECSVQDALAPFYGEVRNATGIVFASPVYFGDISGQGKIWLDRMFPMLDGQAFQPRFPGKKVVTLFAQGDGDAGRFLPAMQRLHSFLHTFGWKLQDNLVCADASSPGYEMPRELLQKAKAAGGALIG